MCGVASSSGSVNFCTVLHIFSRLDIILADAMRKPIDARDDVECAPPPYRNPGWGQTTCGCGWIMCSHKNICLRTWLCITHTHKKRRKAAHIHMMCKFISVPSRVFRAPVPVAGETGVQACSVVFIYGHAMRI